MTVRLRAHHLLCLLTYSGKGYSSAFTTNLDAVADRIQLGEEIVVVSAADDVCAPLVAESDVHCHRESVMRRDVVAAAELSAIFGYSIRPGTAFRLDGELITTMRDAFVAGVTRSACSGCEWFDLCSTTAAAHYVDARLTALRSPSDGGRRSTTRPAAVLQSARALPDDTLSKLSFP